MGAVARLNKPAFADPMDASFDYIRDNYNWLLMQAIGATYAMDAWGPTKGKAFLVAPGWQTTVETATNNYAQPDAIVLTRGTRVITYNFTWTYGTAKWLITAVQMCYNDGVSGEVCQDSITLTYDSADNFMGNGGCASGATTLESWSFYTDEDASWTDLANVVSSTLYAYQLLEVSYFWTTDYLQFEQPVAGSQIPATSPQPTITWITMSIDAFIDDGQGGSAFIDNARITNGGYVLTDDFPLTVDSYPTPAGDVTVVIEGDLAYWGLTNAQALQFAGGTGSFRFDIKSTESPQLTKNVYVGNVRCSFVYCE